MPKRHDPPPPTRVEIDADASMPAVLAEVRRHVDESIVLSVPDQCPVLLTVAEFRALKDTADRAGVSLTIESQVSLRNQLASMFGIRTSSGVSNDASGWRPPDTLLGNTRVYETWVQPTDENETPRRRKRRPDPDRVKKEESRNRKITSVPSGSMDYIDDDADSVIGATARRVGTILAGVLVVALIATVAGWYALPNVTIAYTPVTTTVSSEVNYAVADENASLPSDIAFTAPATSAEADVPFTISVPTTGVKRTPQETAHGQVLLRNPTANAVVVPQGTTLTMLAGVSYTTSTEVTVPAAANNVAGEVTVEITASAPGSVGNAEPGALTGIVADLDVYYSNRDAAIEGGTDIEEAIVDEADIVALEDKVVNEFNRSAAAGWNSQLPDGQAVVEPSVQATQPTFATDAKPGDSAKEISFSGTVHATGLVYDTNVVTEQTAAFFLKSLQEQVPTGFQIDPASVVLTEPLALAASPNNVQFRVSATASASAVLDAGELENLKSDLAGSSWDDAQSRLNAVEKFENYELEISPGWWIKRMPKDSARIDIQVIDSSSQGAAETPAATVED